MSPPDAPLQARRQPAGGTEPTRDPEEHHPSEVRRPVLLVVDADPRDLATTATALTRRFAADYRIATADSAAAGLDILRRLTDHGEQVALVAAELNLPNLDGVAFLEQAAALHWH